MRAWRAGIEQRSGSLTTWGSTFQDGVHFILIMNNQLFKTMDHHRTLRKIIATLLESSVDWGGRISTFCVTNICHSPLSMHISRVLPRNNLRHSGWVWFGWSLWPHQSFWLLHQRNMDIEGMGATILKGPRENTEFRLAFLAESSNILSFELSSVVLSRSKSSSL